jgi:hypothetical protein
MNPKYTITGGEGLNPSFCPLAFHTGGADSNLHDCNTVLTAL